MAIPNPSGCGAFFLPLAAEKAPRHSAAEKKARNGLPLPGQVLGVYQKGRYKHPSTPVSIIPLYSKAFCALAHINSARLCIEKKPGTGLPLPGQGLRVSIREAIYTHFDHPLVPEGFLCGFAHKGNISICAPAQGIQAGAFARVQTAASALFGRS